MRKHDRRRMTALFLLSLSAAVVAAAACGGDDDELVATTPDASTDATTGEAAVADGSGSSEAGNGVDASDAASRDGGVDAAPEAGPGAFVYFVPDNGESPRGSILGFTWNRSTGALSPIAMDAGSPGGQPLAVAATPDGRFVYSGNYLGHSVAAFAVDRATGALSAIRAAADGGEAGDAGELRIGSNVGFVAADPMGRVLYVAGGDRTVKALAIDPTSGALSRVRSVDVVGVPVWLAVDPQARFLIVQQDTGQLSVHRLDSAGLPQAGAAHLSVAFATHIALHPTGTSLYLPDLAGQRVEVKHIDPTSLAVTPLPTADAGVSTYAAAAHPSGRLLVTTGIPLSVYSVADGGALTSLPNDAGVPTLCQSAAFDPTGEHLYIGCLGSGLWSVAVNGTTGALSTPVRVPTPSTRDVPARNFTWITR